MHTAIVIVAGLVVLGFCALAGWLLGGNPGIGTAALGFLPLWVIETGLNMYLGVKRAGFSAASEAPLALIVFAIPAAAAVILWRKLR